jgi:hypothetical protein
MKPTGAGSGLKDYLWYGSADLDPKKIFTNPQHGLPYLPVIGLPDELVVILGLVRAAVIKLGMIGHLMVQHLLPTECTLAQTQLAQIYRAAAWNHSPSSAFFLLPGWLWRGPVWLIVNQLPPEAFLKAEVGLGIG